MLQLRPYQQSAITEIKKGILSGHRSQILYLPTGGGKTEIAIAMLQAAMERGNRAIMIMDRRILVEQTSARLMKYMIDHGVLMAKHPRYLPYKAIQICSAQTIEACGGFPDASLVIIDEAHNSRKSINEFIKNNQKINVIGLSASPFTKGLGAIYDNVVSGTTTKALEELGNLSPMRVFIAKEINMSGAKTVAGEWSQQEAISRGVQITGDIVSEWIKKTHEIFGGPRKTIVFCAGVAHGQDLAQKFKEAGHNFVNLSYKEDDDYKRDMLQEFSKENSSIQGLIATDILTKGFDQADVMIGISARPFKKSFSSHVQQLGRVMRPHADKEAAIWLDHSGNYLRFKDDWEDLYNNGVTVLDDGKEKPKLEPKQEEKDAAKCPECGALWETRGDTCTHCGHVRVRKNNVIAIAGTLEEIKLNGKVVAATPKELLAQIYSYTRAYGNPETPRERAWHLYKSIYPDKKPDWGWFDNMPIVPVSREVGNYIKRESIAYRKAIRKQG